MKVRVPRFQPDEVRELVRPVRRRVRTAVVLTAVSCLATAIGLAAVGDVAAQLLRSGTAGPGVATVVVGGLVGGAVLRLTAEVLAHRADADLARHLRTRLADVLERAPFTWFQQHPAGLVRRVVTDDVTTMHHLVAHSFTDLTAAITAPLCAVVLLAATDVRLLAVLLVPATLAVLLSRRMARISATKAPGYGQAAATMSGEVTEFLHAIPVLAAYGRGGGATARLRRADTAFVTRFLDWAQPLIRPETIQAQLVSPATLLAVVVVAGSAFTAAGWTDPVALVPVILLGLSVSQPLTAISDNTRSLQMARRSATQVRDLLDTPGVDEPGTLPFPDDATLRLSAVAYEVDGSSLLRDVDLTIPHGALVAVVGPSGAGKTTLARLLVGLLEPTAGSIQIGTTPLREIDPTARRTAIGYLDQHSHLLRASLAENIALDEHPHPDRLTAALAAAAAQDILEPLPAGTATVLGQDTPLSGGQQQRVALARLAYAPPRVLVLDEPTSRVDQETEVLVQQGVSELLAGPGRTTTTVVVSHRLETTIAADLVLVLDHGRLVQQGTHEDLVTQDGTYRRLWQAQQLDLGPDPERNDAP